MFLSDNLNFRRARMNTPMTITEEVIKVARRQIHVAVSNVVCIQLKFDMYLKIRKQTLTT
jgi:hypothetical protein